MKKLSERFDLRYCGKCHAMTNHMKLSELPAAVEAAARCIFGDGEIIMNTTDKWKNRWQDSVEKAKQIIVSAEEAAEKPQKHATTNASCLRVLQAAEKEV